MRKQVATDTKRKSRGTLIVPLLSATALSIGAIAAPPRAVAAAGDELIWAAEFNDPAGTQPSRDEWIYDLGRGYVQPDGEHQEWLDNWGNNEKQYYTDNPLNIAHDGQGHLKITPTKDEHGQWYSGRIETRKQDLKPQEGESLLVEARIKRPDTTYADGTNRGEGIWPAFWMLGSGQRERMTYTFGDVTETRGKYLWWPTTGEIDIMEGIQTPGTTNNPLGKEWSTTNVGTVHCGYLVNPGTTEYAWVGENQLGPCREYDGISGATQATGGVNLSKEFHTYGMRWTNPRTGSETIDFLVDGTTYHQVSVDDILDAGRFGSAQDIWDKAFGKGFFILLNVAVGGGFPNKGDGDHGDGSPRPDTDPTKFSDPSMYVDYVRAYRQTQTPSTSVKRIDGVDRYATSAAVAREGWPAGAKVVYLVTGEAYPDALSAGPAAARSDAPILLTRPGSLPEVIRQEILRLDPDNIRVVGGVNAVSESVMAELRGRFDVTRIAGNDRFDTSRRLAESAFQGAGAGQAVIATGLSFPDALSAGAGIGGSGPVLLVDGRAASVGADTQNTLKALGVEQVFIVGGTKAVSSAIEQELSERSVKRLSGADRYETSRAINQHFAVGGGAAMLATGENFPDALSGSAFAARSSARAPLYIVSPTCIPLDILRDLEVGRRSALVLLGGVSALSPAVEARVAC